ncbi:MAG: glycoside hydrolase family 13 protein [Clostridia bacterium]|nr:glycoside hydrolase family 13 protein [Clostridia bacterium]
MYWFNPIYNKLPAGPIKRNQKVTYTLQISKEINSTAVDFCYSYDFSADPEKVSMTQTDIGDKIEYTCSVQYEKSGLYWYHFEVYQGEHKFYLQPKPNFDVEPTGNLSTRFQQLVYNKKSRTKNSFKGGIMYHVFVDRFNRVGKVKPRFDLILRDDWGGEITKNSHDFEIINRECFGGTLKGIEQKLNYFKSLNVSTLYLSPIFEANSYHKYDTADYLKVDSMLGSEKDLKRLIAKARKKDINIILDGVFNHTGSDSIYFNKLNRYDSVGAYQSQKSPYFKWYEFQEHPNKYSSWWGIDTLPQIKKGNTSFVKFLTKSGGVIQKYLNMGILGYRFDVVDELSETTLKAICKSAREVRSSCLLLGEVWEDASNKIAYDERKKYFLGAELDSVMNYPIKDSIINYVTTGNSENLRNTLYMIKDHYPKDVRDNLMTILGTHDTSRIYSVLSEVTNNCDNQTFKLLKIATLIQFTVMGVPCIFYGDEQGLKGVGAPYCRVCFPWDKQNKKIKNWYVFLGELRNNPVFEKGLLNVLCANNGLFGFERVTGRKKVVVYTNCSDKEVSVTLDEKLTNYLTKKQSPKTIRVMPYSFAIFTN